MIDRNDDFARNMQLAIKEQVITGVHKAGQAVFDRREDTISGLIIDGIEKRLEAGSRYEGNIFTEQFDGGFLTERTSGTLKSDPHRPFRCPRKRRRNPFRTRLVREILDATGLVNNSAIKLYDGPIVQWPFIGCTQTFDYFALARVIAQRCARFLLRFANLQRNARALVQQAQ